MMSRIFSFLLVCFLVVGTQAQDYSDSYPINPGVDVIGYVFELEVTDVDDVIHGTTTLDVRFVEAGSRLRLDLINRSEELEGKGMVVQGVESGGVALDFAHADNAVVIDLGREAEAGERVKVQVHYQGIPATGLIIGPNKYGDRTFFSDNWSSKVRNWLPVVDHPSEKAMTEMRVIAPSKYQVASNGTLAEHSDLGDGRRMTHWKNPVPTAPWLYFVGVAQMAVEVVDVWNGVPVETWVYWQDRDAGFYDFAEPSAKVLAYYSDLIGPYVNDRLANIVSNGTPGGGMEAASTPAYSDQSVSGNRERRWQHVIIHEIAHQWFGNAVTEYYWNDVWLSEGFATYYTLLFREHLYGHDDFIAGLHQSRQRVISFYENDYDFALVRPYIEDLNNVSGAMMYQKGAWTLHMLREKMGVEAYNAGIRAYYAEFINKNAQTADLRRHMEAASGMDLEQFFAQWVFQGGIPHLEGSWQQDEDGVEVNFSQVQETYEFELTVDVEVVFEDGSSAIATIEMPIGGSAQVLVPTESKATEVRIDPKTRLLATWSLEQK
ncbi:MAG: M1 family metallopeptidase [Bacteroidetes bacterium]|nr:M1 family metallopeptidase [Bacteroidota bacterium]